MKIAIIGYSGSGKSTLAAALAEKYQLPLLHLDCVRWLPGWVEQDAEVEQKIVADYMDSHESWVIDGNYNSLFQARRMAEADEIIFMNFNRFASLYRAWRRSRDFAGRSRASITEGCDEKFDGEFIRWILWDGRTKARRQHYAAICRQHAAKITIIKNQRQLDAYYKARGLR